MKTNLVEVLWNKETKQYLIQEWDNDCDLMEEVYTTNILDAIWYPTMETNLSFKDILNNTYEKVTFEVVTADTSVNISLKSIEECNHVVETRKNDKSIIYILKNSNRNKNLHRIYVKPIAYPNAQPTPIDLDTIEYDNILKNSALVE